MHTRHFAVIQQQWSFPRRKNYSRTIFERGVKWFINETVFRRWICLRFWVRNEIESSHRISTSLNELNLSTIIVLRFHIERKVVFKFLNRKKRPPLSLQ